LEHPTDHQTFQKAKGNLKKGMELGTLNHQWVMNSRPEKGVDGFGRMDTMQRNCAESERNDNNL
jgi:hypothetical protein